MKHKRYKKVCKVYFLELGILSMDELLRVYVIYFNTTLQLIQTVTLMPKQLFQGINKGI